MVVIVIMIHHIAFPIYSKSCPGILKGLSNSLIPVPKIKIPGKKKIKIRIEIG